MFFIHYHKTTGRIGAWGSGESEKSHLIDHEILRLEQEIPIDPARHRVEDGDVVNIPEKELHLWNMPTRDEMASHVERELTNTDRFMMPDFPVTDFERDRWIAYRQALRTASKGSDSASAMLAAIPVRPDGVDVMAQFRVKE